MSRWGEVIRLITLTEPAPRVNDRGYPNPLQETVTEVYCNQRSIGMAEFYQAAQTGIKVEMKVEVRSADYSGQKLAEFGGKRYTVLRTFTAGSGEITELTLSDLAERQEG